MHSYSRKEFLFTTALLLGGAASFGKLPFGKKPPKLAFSTLGCPDWPLEKITGFAREHGYTGIEVRGIQRELDLTKSPYFNSPAAISATLDRMKANGLQFVGLGSSSTLHFADPLKRQQQLDDGRRFIDLAAKLNCPYVRVFPNNFPKDQEKEQTMDLITRGLLELADHAKGSKVTVLMETHGDLVYKADLLRIMKAAEHRHTGLVWDLTNMWSITREAPAEVYKDLKPYIRHTHIKDAKLKDGKLEYCLLGKGDIPIMEAISLLAKDNYKGFYSFEWEKLWHPEIAEPEIAFADFPKVMKAHLDQ
ncbi:sugar phosphate isomerase/epimerase [Flavihumibacter rivuli]|uniref:sugar phosphate isomerase/epimerase family protein n=1 Tax=Flavihumibacter rivuli TaxID=2838156 RepID=UPI001BDEAFA2|nr:sugar phosphate isomerase/epimerase family protein [Flavihumibacter rivuli]ULQ55951.1 sugar phosphate isomerase/epimerase [Flavihumibacter rivuli]